MRAEQQLEHVFISSMGDHAPLLDTRVEQQVEHGFNKFYGKQCNPSCHDGLTNSWSMVSVSYSGNHVPPDFMKVEQKLEHGLCHF